MGKASAHQCPPAALPERRTLRQVLGVQARECGLVLSEPYLNLQALREAALQVRRARSWHPRSCGGSLGWCWAIPMSSFTGYLQSRRICARAAGRDNRPCLAACRCCLMSWVSTRCSWRRRRPSASARTPPQCRSCPPTLRVRGLGGRSCPGGPAGTGLTAGCAEIGSALDIPALFHLNEWIERLDAAPQ